MCVYIIHTLCTPLSGLLKLVRFRIPCTTAKSHAGNLAKGPRRHGAGLGLRVYNEGFWGLGVGSPRFERIVQSCTRAGSAYPSLYSVFDADGFVGFGSGVVASCSAICSEVQGSKATACQRAGEA